jgi:hypothetical protein
MTRSRPFEMNMEDDSLMALDEGEQAELRKWQQDLGLIDMDVDLEIEVARKDTEERADEVRGLEDFGGEKSGLEEKGSIAADQSLVMDVDLPDLSLQGADLDVSLPAFPE